MQGLLSKAWLGVWSVEADATESLRLGQSLSQQAMNTDASGGTRAKPQRAALASQSGVPARIAETYL